MTIQKNVPVADVFPKDSEHESSPWEGMGVGLLDLWRVCRMRRKLIINTMLVFVALMVAFVFIYPAEYTATSVVMLDQQKNNVEDTAAVLTDLPSDPATVQNQVQILESDELANRVINKLHLDQDEEFNPTPNIFDMAIGYVKSLLPSDEANLDPKELVRLNVLDRFEKNLDVEPLGLSTAMSVEFKSEYPDKAARIANAIGDAYVEDQLDAKFEATRKATQWLSARIAELSRQTQAADAAVAQYKQQHNITLTEDGGSVVDQQIATLNSSLIAAKTDLEEKEASYSRLKDLARSGEAAGAAEVMASPVVAALRAQEAELAAQMADLASKYGPRHPKILDLEAQKEALDGKISQEVERVVDASRNDVAVAETHVSSLEQSLKELETQNASENKAEVVLTGLQSNADAARSMYQAFLGQLNQTQDQAGIQTSDGRVISAATVPIKPSFPKKGLMIGASIPAGLFLGFLLALAIERLDSGFRTTGQLERLVGVPVFATVPEWRGGKNGEIAPADAVLEKPTSAFSEAIRGLQLGLTLANVDSPPKVIVVASSVPDEGKTTIAVSLARLAARSGLKAIIVDSDLRHPNVASTLGLRDIQGGLVEVMAHQIPLDKCVVRDPRSDLLVVPCLKTSPNASDMLSSVSMRNLIANLKNSFDVVIIDSAPVLPVNDTKVLGHLADAMLFVVRWEKTPREAVVSAVRSLTDVNVPVTGVVMTRADQERFRHYSYGHQNYYSYGKYYSD